MQQPNSSSSHDLVSSWYSSVLPNVEQVVAKNNVDPELLVDELKPKLAGEAFMSVREIDITKRDIKIGRRNHRTEKTHPGNVFFRRIINERFDLYESMDKASQTELAFHIIAALKHDGRRFVKKTETGGWEVADDNVAREKISITFRSIRKQKKRVCERKSERQTWDALFDKAMEDVRIEDVRFLQR